MMVSATEFRQEVVFWLQTLTVTPKEVHLRAISSKWPSCSSKGRLAFLVHC